VWVTQVVSTNRTAAPSSQLQALRPKLAEVETVLIEPHALRYQSTPSGLFKRARERLIPASTLAEVCCGWWPPTLRTRDGEYLFVPATQMHQLADFAQANGVPFVDREDLWTWVLEPFLDTEFSAEDTERVVALLERGGLPRDELRRLRERVEGRMLELTAVTWEWQHYGLADVLAAMATAPDFDVFRREAFALADRGRVKVVDRAEFLRFAPKP
jgi:hypothetical protein